MRQTYKNLISLCAVLIFALTISVTAFADPFSISVGIGGASGAGMFGAAAGSFGVSVGVSGNDVDPYDAFWTDYGDGVELYSGDKHKSDGTEWDPYDKLTLDIESTIKLVDKIQTLQNTYSLTDNDSYTVSQSYFENVPLNTRIFVPYGSSVTLNSTITLTNILNGSTYYLSIVADGNTTILDNTLASNIQNYPNPSVILSKSGNDKLYAQAKYDNYTGTNKLVLGPNQQSYDPSVLNIPITTTTIDYSPANNKKAVLKMPTNPDLPIDFDTAEFLRTFSEGIIAGTSGYTIEYESDGPTPPPPVPIPTTPLGDLGTDEFYDLIGLPILEGQEEIIQDINDFSEDVSDSLNDIGEQLDDTNDSLESIDTNIGIGNGILTDIKTLAQTISSTLSNILQGVQDLVQEIVLSTETFIAGLLNSIMGGLGGWLSTMRNAFSIWHYVVEWLGSISSCFTWFWSMVGSTSYYIQLPIYACLAGSVVLAFYKRFGR